MAEGTVSTAKALSDGTLSHGYDFTFTVAGAGLIYATSHTITYSAETQDITSKADKGKKNVTPTKINWEAQVQAYCTEADYSALTTAMNAMELVDCNGGKGYITNLSVTGGVDDIKTVSVTVTGASDEE